MGALKFKTGHMTTNTPSWGMVCHPKANTSLWATSI